MVPIKTHFNLSAEEYEVARGGHLEHRRFEEVIHALEVRSTGLRHVLEIGFGSGKLLAELASRFPEVQFHGLEVEPKMVEHAKGRYVRPNLHYALGDLCGDGPRGPYDFAYCIDVVHHVHDHIGFFCAVRRCLRDGGSWIVIEPNILHPYIYYLQEKMKRAGFDEDHFRPWAIEPLWHRAGFDILSRRFVFLFPGWISHIPPPLMRIERLAERFRFLGGSIKYELTARGPAAH